MPLRTVTLSDGKKVPCLAFGTGTALTRTDSTASTLQALNHKFVHIDCAWAYRNQQYTGAAIRESGLKREEVFITTKCGDFDGKPEDCDPRAMLLESLKDLQLNYVDLYLIHADFLVSSVTESWKVMEQLQKEGLTKSIGVSNFSSKNLQAILDMSTIKPAVQQIEFHPYALPTYQPKLLPLCREHGIVIECYGPLVSIIRKRDWPVDAVAQAIAKERGHGETEGQILLAWAQQISGGVVVTTSSSGTRLDEQIQPFLSDRPLPPLSQSELDRIQKAGAEAPYRNWPKMMENEGKE